MSNARGCPICEETKRVQDKANIAALEDIGDGGSFVTAMREVNDVVSGEITVAQLKRHVERHLRTAVREDVAIEYALHHERDDYQ